MLSPKPAPQAADPEKERRRREYEYLRLKAKSVAAGQSDPQPSQPAPQAEAPSAMGGRAPLAGATGEFDLSKFEALPKVQQQGTLTPNLIDAAWRQGVAQVNDNFAEQQRGAPPRRTNTAEINALADAAAYNFQGAPTQEFDETGTMVSQGDVNRMLPARFGAAAANAAGPGMVNAVLEGGNAMFGSGYQVDFFGNPLPFDEPKPIPRVTFGDDNLRDTRTPPARMLPLVPMDEAKGAVEGAADFGGTLAGVLAGPGKAVPKQAGLGRVATSIGAKGTTGAKAGGYATRLAGDVIENTGYAGLIGAAMGEDGKRLETAGQFMVDPLTWAIGPGVSLINRGTIALKTMGSRVTPEAIRLQQAMQTLQRGDATPAQMQAAARTIDEMTPPAPDSGPAPSQADPAASTGARSKSMFSAVNEYSVSTADSGVFGVNLNRTQDGGAVILHDKGTIPIAPEFAKGKSDEELLAYYFEPIGYQGATKGPTAAAQPQPSVSPVAQPTVTQGPRGGAQPPGGPPPQVPAVAGAAPGPQPAQGVASLGEAEVWFNSLPQKNREAILRTFAASGVESKADQFAIIADLNSLPPGRNSQNYFLISQKWGEQYPSLRENLSNMGGDFSATNPRAPDQKFLGIFGKGKPDRAQGILDTEGRKQVVSERGFLERSAETNFGAPSAEVAQQFKDELAGLGKRYNWLLDPTRQRKFQDPEKIAALQKSTEDLQAYLAQPWIVDTMPPAVKNRLLTDASKEMRRLGWSPEELKIILAGDDRSILAPLFEAHGPLQWSPDVWKHIVTQYPKFAAHILQSSYATAARDLAKGLNAADNVGTVANLGRMRGIDEAGNVVPGGLLDRLQQTMPNSDFSFVGKGSYADTRVNWGDIKGATEALDITRRFKAAAQSGENVVAIMDEMEGLSPRAKDAALSEITSFIHDSLGNKVRNVRPGQVGQAAETIPNLTQLGNDNFLSALRKVFGDRGDALANDIELARSSTDSMMMINRRIGPNTRIKDENIKTAKNVYEDPAGLDSNVVDSTVKVAAAAGAGAAATGQMGAAATLAGLASLQAVWNKVKQARRLSNTERSLLADFMFRSRQAGQNGEALLDASLSAPPPRSPNLPSRAGYAANVLTGAAAGGAVGAVSGNGDPNAVILGILGGAGAGGLRAKGRSAKANSSIIKPRPVPGGNKLATPKPPPAKTGGKKPPQSNASPAITGALVGGGIGAAANPDDPGRGALYGAMAGGAVAGLGNRLSKMGGSKPKTVKPPPGGRVDAPSNVQRGPWKDTPKPPKPVSERQKAKARLDELRAIGLSGKQARAVDEMSLDSIKSRGQATPDFQRGVEVATLRGQGIADEQIVSQLGIRGGKEELDRLEELVGAYDWGHPAMRPEFYANSPEQMSPMEIMEFRQLQAKRQTVTPFRKPPPGAGGKPPPVGAKAAPPPFKPIEGAERIDTTSWTPTEFNAARKQLNEMMQDRRTMSGQQLAELDREITSLRNALDPPIAPEFADVPMASRFNAPVDQPWPKGSPADTAIKKAIEGKNWTVQSVPLAKIIPTQDSVFFDYAKAAGRYAGDDRLPIVVKQGDQYFVADGHHRLMAQGGAGQVRARVIDLAPSKGPGGKPHPGTKLSAFPGADEGAKLPMDEASRMQRAREMGFDVDTPLYHGTAADVEAFDFEDIANMDFDTGAGVFLTRSPSEAGYFVKTQTDSMGSRSNKYVKDANIMPVYARLRNPVVFETQADFRAAVADASYDRRGHGYGFKRDMEALGHDGVIVRNSQMDGQDGAEWRIVFDPSNIRGKFAAFDPSQEGSSKLLSAFPGGTAAQAASGAGGAAYGYANPVDANEDGVIDDQDRAITATTLGLGGLTAAGLARNALSRGPRGVKPPPGKLNTFGGVNAKTADRAALARAQQMETAGASRDDIWDQTGWFKGVDGKWRFEIDDSGATVTEPVRFGQRYYLNENYGANDLKASFDHPAAFAAYPDTPKIKAGNMMDDFAAYHPEEDLITLPGTAKDPRSVILHENQHAIQTRENFANGGAPENFVQQKEAELARDAMFWRREIAAKRKEMPQADWSAVENAVIRDYQTNDIMDWLPSREARDLAHDRIRNPDAQLSELVTAYGLDKSVSTKSPREMYRSLAGETEARNVQTRRDFSPAERKAKRPWDTQDVPDDQQIVRFGGGKAESRPTKPPPASNAFGGGKGKPKPEPRPVLGGRVIKQVQQAAKSLPPEVRNRLSANAQLPVGARKSAVEAAGDDPSIYRMAAPFQNAKPGPIMRQAERVPTITGKSAFPRPANPIDEGVNASLDRIERNVGPPRSLDPIAEAAGIAERRRRAAVAEASRWNAKVNTQTREAQGLPDMPVPKALARNEQEATELAIAAKRALAAANLETTSAQEARAWAEQRKEAIIEALLGQSDGAKPVGVMATRMQVGGASSKTPPVRPPKPVSYQDARDMAELLFDADNAKMLDDVLSGRVKPKNRDDHHMALLMLGGATGLGITGLAIANDAPERTPPKDNYDPQQYMNPGDPRYVWDWEKMKTNREDMQALQINLNALPPNKDDARYNLSVNTWGPKTEAALKNWQYENGFNPDGAMTAEQWELLDSQALAARRNEPARTGQRR